MTVMRRIPQEPALDKFVMSEPQKSVSTDPWTKNGEIHKDRKVGRKK